MTLLLVYFLLIIFRYMRRILHRFRLSKEETVSGAKKRLRDDDVEVAERLRKVLHTLDVGDDSSGPTELWDHLLRIHGVSPGLAVDPGPQVTKRVVPRYDVRLAARVAVVRCAREWLPTRALRGTNQGNGF